MTRQKFLMIVWLGAALLFSGCGLVYRIDVQQGNIITQEMLNKLQLGMTTRKVVYVMGNPMIQDQFHQGSNQQRWDYFYSFREGWKDPEKRRVSLFFEDDRLVRVEGASIGAGSAPAEETPERGEPVL